MLLLERVKLRRLSKNPSLDDLRMFTFTCCGTLVTLYCITIPQDNNEAGELLSYKMIWCESYSLIDQEQIIELAKTLNRIHFYGQTVHLQGIMSDIQAVKEAKSIADIDKHTYEYKGDNTFEQEDELLIVDQCNMTNTSDVIASEAEPGVSTSGASDSDSQ